MPDATNLTTDARHRRWERGPDANEWFAPVQPWGHGRGQRMPAGRVPWSVHLEAWQNYAKRYGRDQSAERIAERGGFSYRELQWLLGGVSKPFPADYIELPDVPGWERV